MNLNFPIQFTKMSGTGNDFIIIDHRQPFIEPKDQPQFARLICRRKFSAGADGLILIENSAKADFRWQFYNADGSAAEMCGNGARCAAKFAFVHSIAQAQMSFETIAGIIEAQMIDDSVRLKLTSPSSVNLGLNIDFGGPTKHIHSINTGVPHVVHFVDEIDQANVETWGRNIRFHETFQPAGTNVNFVQVYSANEIHVRTYERGVEGETLACGTGAVASAIIAALCGKAESPVQVTTSGGEKLTIYFTSNLKTHQTEQVLLEGPAHFIYKADLDQEALV